MIERRIGHQGVGFGSIIQSKEQRDTGEMFEHCLPEDLIQYGLIPEFIGRLPVMSAIHQLSRDELMQILTEPRNALVKQFQRFFQFDGIELVFADEALVSIADKALERETGARGLRSIIEEVLLEVQFELPSRRDVREVRGHPRDDREGRLADAGHGRRARRGRSRGIEPSSWGASGVRPGRWTYVPRTPARPIGPPRLRHAMSDLESRTRYEPAEVEPRIAKKWLDSGLFHPSPRGGAGQLLDRDSAAERDRRAAHGPRVPGLDHGHADPPPPDARSPHEVDPRHRPRRDRDPDPGRACPRAGGHQP